MALFHCMVRFGTVHFWGVFHWVLYLVPGTFLVPPQPRFQAIRTVTKTWHVNSADHWLAGENRRYCHCRTCDMRPARFKSAQPAKERTQDAAFVSTKRTFLHQPQIICFIVCWGSSDVPLVDSRGADPVMARRRRKKPYVYTCYIFRVCLLFIFLPLYVCFASIKNNLIE